MFFYAQDILSLNCVFVNISKVRKAILKSFEFFLDLEKNIGSFKDLTISLLASYFRPNKNAYLLLKI